MKELQMIKSCLFVLMAVLFMSGNTNAIAGPINDNCYNAIAIEEVENLSFNTSTATFDGPGLKITSPNIWYRYTANCTGTVTISLCGSYYDTMLAVYSGSACYPTLSRLLAWNDDFCDFQSKVTISATAGSSYLIEVGGYNNNTGYGVLNITCASSSPAPTNNNCSNAKHIGNVTNLAFSTTYATFDGPGLCKPSNPGPNIWYLYTAPATCQVTVSLCGSSFDTILAIYDGYQCPPVQSRMLKCNDDYCGKQSQATFNAIAGSQYLIEVGGFEPSQKGQGYITVSGTPVETAEPYDLGDAPDSTNNMYKNMIAYSEPTTVFAHYPTVFADGSTGPYGPIHLQPKAIAYLGESVTYEDEADSGVDNDGVNNIVPNTGANNQDNGDDGVVFPIEMPTGQWTTFDYMVNVVEPGTDLWVNVWLDFNRDGDWGDDTSTNPEMFSETGFISEWAVQNQFLYNLPAGLNILTTPAFISWKAEGKPGDIWMRITLSETPWTGGSGVGGSGPQTGYFYGETEDYYFSPNTTCSFCRDLNHDGQINTADLWYYIDQWMDNCQ